MVRTKSGRMSAKYLQRCWNIHLARRALHCEQFFRVSPSAPMEEYTKNVHVIKVAKYVDDLLCNISSSKNKFEAQFVYACYFFTCKCKHQDQKTQRIAILAQTALRYFTACLRSFRAKKLPSVKLLHDLSSAVEDMYNYHPIWLQFQTRLSDSLLHCTEAFAKMKKLLLNSADLYEEGHPNAALLREGARRLLDMNNTLHCLIPLGRHRRRSLEIEELIDREYAEAEDPTDDLFHLEDEIQNFADVVEQAHEAVVGRCCLYKFYKSFVEPIMM